MMSSKYCYKITQLEDVTKINSVCHKKLTLDDKSDTKSIKELNIFMNKLTLSFLKDGTIKFETFKLN